VRTLAVAVAVSTGLALAVGCAALRRPYIPEGPLRVSELVAEGDAARRASVRLVLRGLDADAEAREHLALSQYERAIRVDPTNPFAYLAIARHRAHAGDSLRALEYLDQVEILLDSQQSRSPRVEPHLLGLRGVALEDTGRRDEAVALLTRARQLAPSVWGDGRLSAGELR
jgi:tetratricopeptide (TPR) repeat protein